MKNGNFIFASAFKNGGVSDNWSGSLPERYSSAWPCLPQNSHHRCENFTPKPHLSLRKAILSSFSIFPKTIPKPISTMGFGDARKDVHRHGENDRGVLFHSDFSHCLQIPELNTHWLLDQQAGLIL
jgi:hypothetical protein